MLPVLVAVAAGGIAGERDYRVTVHAAPRSAVSLHVQVPAGWIAAFCTPSVCAPGHVVVHVPQNGSSVIALHIYRVEGGAAHRANVAVRAGAGRPTTLAVAF
jgi:hypothetical protein